VKVREPTLLVFQLPWSISVGRPHFCMFWDSGFGFVLGKLKGSRGVAGRQRTPLPGSILVRNDREGEKADSPASTANFSRADLFKACFGYPAPIFVACC
jgi:hypothetical protein